MVNKVAPGRVRRSAHRPIYRLGPAERVHRLATLFVQIAEIFAQEAEDLEITEDLQEEEESD